MTKILYNDCFGGFGLSEEAIAEYNKRTGNDIKWSDDIERDDPVLVAIVEEMGSGRASGGCAELRIIDLEPGTKYYIDEYDGRESVLTPDNIDWKIA